MPVDFFGLVQNFGLPLGLLIIAIATVLRGDWIPRKNHESTIQVLKESHIEIVKTMQESFSAQLARAEKATEDWRYIAVHGLDNAEDAAAISKELAAKVSRR